MSPAEPTTIRSAGGTILARVSGLSFGIEQPKGQRRPLKRYTAFCSWPEAPGDYEEIDVDAIRPVYARRCAAEELARNYEPGGRVMRVQERFGLYL